MKSNIVLADRTARMGLGMLLLASPLLELHTYPFNLFGLVLVATGFIGFCPIYSVLGTLGAKPTTPAKPAHVRAR